MPQETPIAVQMRAKLKAAFAPQALIIADESAKHAGHAGAHSQGESHFAVTITAAAFNGKSRLERQRMVNSVLAEELAARVHALRLTVRGLDEHKK
ncbi:MAG: BolA family transcriptional regulator [Alphaproteobacteria bacterium]|nr:BolA family transcriptional regulator [Alphaproteobacteria bacterium]